MLFTLELAFVTNGLNNISLFVFVASTKLPNKSLVSVFSDSVPSKSNKFSRFDVTGSSSNETDEKFNKSPSLGLFGWTSIFGGNSGLGGALLVGTFDDS